MSDSNTQNNTADQPDMKLFWGCFLALIATSAAFIIRALIIDDWATDFNLTETQKGELFGVGLWPFAISIVLFSLIIDKIGYGRAMVFAFVCHVASAIITIFASGYWGLYIGTFIVALGNGTVEAVINPVVATMFRKEKAKWLNILHAGWPAGLVLGGLIVIFMGEVDWRFKVGILLIPTVIYGLMLARAYFPVNERVAAGVSYMDMLKEAGIIGCLIVVTLVTLEIGRVFSFPTYLEVLIVVVLTGIYGFYVRSLGQPLFIFLLIIMMPLAVTELGTDSWISDLMRPAMTELGINAGWVLVYTSFIMMLLRFFAAGPLVQRFTPLGLLAICCVIAIAGLYWLSMAAGVAILVAATFYGFGKSFFWPTMLGIVAERFPKGGALTLNAIAGVGMLSVGILGNPLLGNIQDRQIVSQIQEHDAEVGSQLFETYVTEEEGTFGDYFAVNKDLLNEALDEDSDTIQGITDEAKKSALATVAILPFIMLICYIVLILYFKSRGGYLVVDLEHGGGEDAADGNDTAEK